MGEVAIPPGVSAAAAAWIGDDAACTGEVAPGAVTTEGRPEATTAAAVTLLATVEASTSAGGYVSSEEGPPVKVKWRGEDEVEARLFVGKVVALEITKPPVFRAEGDNGRETERPPGDTGGEDIPL